MLSGSGALRARARSARRPSCGGSLSLGLLGLGFKSLGFKVLGLGFKV